MVTHPRKIRIQMLGLLPWMGANAVRAKWTIFTSDPERVQPERGDSPAVVYVPAWANIPYAFTDGRTLGLRLEYLEAAASKGKEFDVVLTAGHEAVHFSLGHCERMVGKHPGLWNIAADDRVNRILRKLLSYEAQNNQLEIKMPPEEWVFLEGPEWDADIKDEMTVEEVYMVLLRRQKNHQQKCPACGQKHAQGQPQQGQGQPQSGGQGQGTPQPGQQPGANPGGSQPAPGKKGTKTKEWGAGAPQNCSDKGMWEIEQMLSWIQDVMMSPEPDPSKREAEAYDKATSFARKIQEAVGKGNLPGNFAELVKIQAPKRRWDDAVSQFVAVNRTKQDFSLKRPSAYYRMQGMAVATMNDEHPTIMMALDTSGSVPSEHIGQFLGIALAVCNYGNRVIIVECDTQVYEQNIKILEPGTGAWDDPDLAKVKGRGGTFFKPVLHYAKKLQEEGEEIGGVMFFTDAGNFDTLEPSDYPDGLPILWVFTTDLNPNGHLEGDVVRFDPNER